MPKWQLLGAFCGVPYIVIMVLAVQRIGTATATVAVIFGQLTMSLLIDNFGWLGNSTMAFSPARLAAVICLALALYLIYTSGSRLPPTWRPAQNSELRRRVGHREYSLTRHGQG